MSCREGFCGSLSEPSSSFSEGVAQVSLSALARAPCALARQIALDVESLPLFMPGLDSAKIEERRPNGSLVVAQSGRLSFGPFFKRVRSRQLIESDAFEARSSSLPGSDFFAQSRLRFVSKGSDSCLIEQLARISAPDWMPESMARTLARAGASDSMEALVGHIERVWKRNLSAEADPALESDATRPQADRLRRSPQIASSRAPVSGPPSP